MTELAKSRFEMVVKSLNSWFWQDRFWLPGNSTWKEISGPEYPNYYDLFTYSLPIAFGMLVLRQIIDG